MRVLYIVDIGNKGGASLQFLDMINGLIGRKNFKPIVLTSKKTRINDQLDELGIENYAIGYKSFFVPAETGKLRFCIKILPRVLEYVYTQIGIINRLDKKLDLSHIDIVHSYINRVDLGAKIKKKYKNIFHIWHIHEFGEKDYNCVSLIPNYVSYMNKNADMFVMVSEAVKKEWAKKGIDVDRSIVIYNGINSTFLLKERETNCSKIRIVMVGTLCKTKGQMQLIEAFDHLQPEMKKRVEIDFWGNGASEYVHFLKRKVQRIGGKDAIHFLGYHNNISQNLGEYDIGITASRSEAFGRVTVEYMMAGLCAIVSDTGANQELVKNNETGLVYTYGDSKELAKKIEYAIQHEQVRSQLGKQARSYAEQNFSLDKYCDNIYKLYEMIDKN